MTTKDLNRTLSLLGVEEANHEELLELIRYNKGHFLTLGNQDALKQLWICEQVVEVHKEYLEAFRLIKSKDYYEGWKKLETVEIQLLHLSKHFDFSDDDCGLGTVHKRVISFQKIYPYSLFFSSEIITKVKQCTICGNVVNIRKSCGHIVGEIYNGEMCGRLVTESEFKGVAIVENPVNKYSVCFIQENGIQIEYEYASLDFLTEKIENPYEFWDVEIEMRLLPVEWFEGTQPEDTCPCGSEKTYGDCCLVAPQEYMHHTFILNNKPSSKTTIMIGNQRKSF